MTNYNYLEAMIEDVKEYLRNEAEYDQEDLFYNRSYLEEKLHDELWCNELPDLTLLALGRLKSISVTTMTNSQTLAKHSDRMSAKQSNAAQNFVT